MRKHIFIALFVALFLPNVVLAANWVQVLASDKEIEYIDTSSLNWADQNERIVEIVRKSVDANGYDIVLEKYSLTNNTNQMNAIISFSKDGSIKTWQVIDNKKGFWSCITGPEWKKIHPEADGVKILAFLKDAEKRGLIMWETDRQ